MTAKSETTQLRRTDATIRIASNSINIVRVAKSTPSIAKRSKMHGWEKIPPSFRPVAQLVEYSSPKRGVVGSIPAWPAFGNAAISGGVLAEKQRRRTTLAEKAKKQNAIQNFFRETAGELRKVSWPTWPEARRLTILVLIVMVAMGIYLSLVDLMAESLLNLVLGL